MGWRLTSFFFEYIVIAAAIWLGALAIGYGILMAAIELLTNWPGRIFLLLVVLGAYFGLKLYLG